MSFPPVLLHFLFTNYFVTSNGVAVVRRSGGQTATTLVATISLFSHFNVIYFFLLGFLAIPGSKLANPSLGFVVRTLSISLCYTLQVFWLHKEPLLLSSIGSALICISIVAQSIIAILRAPRSKPDQTSI